MRGWGKHAAPAGGLEIFKYIGPGFLVTVGFIDPGNWAANMAAGSTYGYSLLWVVTLSTLMLILLQHNAAHLGIVTGLCLSEACAKYLRRGTKQILLISAVGASISTALAEIFGAAIGLHMLFGLPLSVGAVLTCGLVLYMLFSNSYLRLEKWILGFVSLIGLAFLLELVLVKIPWAEAAHDWVVPSFPAGSIAIVMSILGAVVMPHNIFLHSEVIQSRQWNIRGEEVIQKQLKYEFVDTLSAMMVGWAINSAMILVAAAVFYTHGAVVTELPQAQATLKPLLGNAAAVIFALALLFSGFSSSITAGMAGGSIFAGIYQEPFNMADRHSRVGVYLTLFVALGIILFLRDPFQGLLWSQIILSIQLPFTVLPLILLTSCSGALPRR
jgi:manganese transport protein